MGDIRWGFVSMAPESGKRAAEKNPVNSRGASPGKRLPREGGPPRRRARRSPEAREVSLQFTQPGRAPFKRTRANPRINVLGTLWIYIPANGPVGCSAPVWTCECLEAPSGISFFALELESGRSHAERRLKIPQIQNEYMRHIMRTYRKMWHIPSHFPGSRNFTMNNVIFAAQLTLRTRYLRSGEVRMAPTLHYV